MNTYFNFEIYIYNNDMTISGWEIKMISVKADTKTQAKELLKKYPLFDCIILFNFQHNENENFNYLETENYEHFKILKKFN